MKKKKKALNKSETIGVSRLRRTAVVMKIMSENTTKEDSWETE